MKTNQYPYYFVLPAFGVYLLMFFYPTVASFWYSVTDWSLNRDTISFIGLRNFQELILDPKLLAAVPNTLTYAASVTIIRNTLGLVLALMLNERIRGRDILRTVFFLPFVIAPIIIGYLFRALYQPAHGLVNQFLRLVGFSFLTTDWLNNPDIALFSTIMVDVWRTTGFAMVIYLAGLQVIPRELYESAELDGAHYRNKLRYVTLPLLAPAVTVNLVLSLIGTMKVFVMIVVLTGGGPGYATQVLNTYIRSTFSLGLFGLATAANLLLSLLVTVIGLPVLYLLRRREVEL